MLGPAAPAEVLVRVACALVDAGRHSSTVSAVPPATFVGRLHDATAAQEGWVVGVGPLGARVAARRDLLQPVSLAGSPVEGALFLPYLAPLITAVTDAGVGFGDRVVISGEGLLGRLAAHVVSLHTGASPRVLTPDESAALAASGPGTVDRTTDRERARDTDVLIETTAEPQLWPSLLSLVRRTGRVVLVIPPGPYVHPFDFYRTIHKGSLTMLVRRVPAVHAAARDADRFLLHLLGSGLIEVAGLVEEAFPNSGDGTAHAHTGTTGGGVIYRFEQ